MRVLTFNSHQPYIHLLASVMPWQLGVITPRLSSERVKVWNPRIRPLPENVRIFQSAAAALRESDWDWVLTHNAQDLMDSREIALPKVFLVHGTLSGRILQDRATIDRAYYLQKLQTLLRANRCRVIYISELKQRDWGIPGEVIRTAIDSSQYGGYRGDRRGVLQVCNHIRERGKMLGWGIHQTVCRNLPRLILGENGNLECSRHAHDWEDLKEQYRSYRIYLHTAAYPHEDGYNLAVLEAMAAGMPIAVLHHPTSPIEHGVDGVVGESAEDLREKVVRLLDDQDLAFKMGCAARKKLETAFPIETFQCAWRSLAESLG